ncbi:hypothetical protein Droror1_Dr00027755, partial [Drosera rotundifolia]
MRRHALLSILHEPRLNPPCQSPTQAVAAFLIPAPGVATVGSFMLLDLAESGLTGDVFECGGAAGTGKESSSVW